MAIIYLYWLKSFHFIQNDSLAIIFFCNYLKERKVLSELTVMSDVHIRTDGHIRTNGKRYLYILFPPFFKQHLCKRPNPLLHSSPTCCIIQPPCLIFLTCVWLCRGENPRRTYARHMSDIYPWYMSCPGTYILLGFSPQLSSGRNALKIY